MVRNGFTLIELLVVVGITALLSAYVIVWSNAARRQTTLYTERAKIAQVLLRARDFALVSFNKPTPACGYGVHFDYVNNTYDLHSYTPLTPGDFCSAIENADIPSEGQPNSIPGVPDTYALNSDVRFVPCVGGNRIDYAYFIPPDPRAVLWVDGHTASSSVGTVGEICVETNDGNLQTTISVNSRAQVTF